MAEIKETVTTSRDDSAPQQQTRKVNTTVSGGSQSVAANVVWYIVGFVEVLLTFRFVLKLFGANPSSGFVDFIYNISGMLTGPFDNIFRGATTEGNVVKAVFEPSILIAMAVYALIGWGIVKLVHLNKPA